MNLEDNKKPVTAIVEAFSGWQVGLYALVLLFCFVTFQHSDLYHTIASSYAYLIGHFGDFYDYNKLIVARNDYLPIVFLIFAALNFPLKLMGLAHPISQTLDMFSLNISQIVLCKFFLVMVFFATVGMVYKIAKFLAAAQVEKAGVAAAILATAPIAVFAVFIFGQYDIFGVFFTAVGFYYYLKKDFLKFALFFSIAVSFKFFALIIFVPLLLLARKNILSLLNLGFIGISFSLFQMALYWHSAVFRQEIFDIASAKLGKTQGGWSFSITGTCLLASYAILCLYAFLKKPINDESWRKTAVLICIPAYAAIFASVSWHPQWIIIPMPFFALSALYIRNKNILYFADTIGMLAFTWCVVDNYPGIDAWMCVQGLVGIIGGFFQHMLLIDSDLLSGRVLPFFKTLFGFYLFSPLLIVAYEKYLQKEGAGGVSEPRKNYYFMARFAVGLSFFLVPTLLCALLPYNIASKIKPDAFVKYLEQGTVLISEQRDPVGEIVPGFTVIQSFEAEHDKLRVVAILLATYGRHNTSHVKISLLNDRGQELASQVVDAKKLEDSNFYNFSFPVIEDSANKTYKVEITSVDGSPGNAITAWMSKTNLYPDGTLTVNNVQEPGDLMFKLYYQVCPEGEICPEAQAQNERPRR